MAEARRGSVAVAHVEKSLQEREALQNAKQEMVEFREAFALFDRDKSGEIDQDELNGALLKLGFKCSEEEITEIFDDADVHGTGEIGFEAFAKLMRKGFRKPNNNARGQRGQQPRRKNGERQFTDMRQYTTAIFPPEPRFVNHQRRRFIAPLGGHLGTSAHKMVEKSLFLKAHRPRGVELDTRINSACYLQGLKEAVDTECFERHVGSVVRKYQKKVSPQDHFQAQLQQQRLGTSLRPSTAPAELVTGPKLRRKREAKRVQAAACSSWAEELMGQGKNRQSMHKLRSQVSRHQRGPILEQAWTSASSSLHGLADTVRFGGYSHNDRVKDLITGRECARSVHADQLKVSSGLPERARMGVARRDRQLVSFWDKKMCAVELIQRTWRGHFSRTFSCLRAQLRKRCVSRIQRWYRHRHSKRMALKMLKQGRDVRIQRVQCRWYRLGWCWFRWMKAALLVSSAWRGHMDRTRARRMPGAALMIVQMCRRRAARKKLRLKSIVRVLAVTRCVGKMLRRQKVRIGTRAIQSWWRHWGPRRKFSLAVKQVMQHIWASKILQRAWRMHKFLTAVGTCHTEYVTTYEASVKIQNMYRNWRSRRFIRNAKHARALWRLKNLVDNHHVMRATREIWWHFETGGRRAKSVAHWEVCRTKLCVIIKRVMHEELMNSFTEELARVLHGVPTVWERYGISTNQLPAASEFEMRKLNMTRAYSTHACSIRQLFLLTALEGIKTLDKGLRISKIQLQALVKECGLTWVDKKRCDATLVNCLKPVVITTGNCHTLVNKEEKAVWKRGIGPKEKEETKTIELAQLVEALVVFTAEMQPFKKLETPQMHHCWLSLCERFLVPGASQWWARNFNARQDELDPIEFSEESEKSLTKFFKFYSKSDTTDKGHKTELNCKEWWQMLTECKMTSKDVSLQLCMQVFLTSGSPNQLRGYLNGGLREFEILEALQIEEPECFLAAMKQVLVRPTNKKPAEQQIEDGIKKMIKNCPHEALIKRLAKS